MKVETRLNVVVHYIAAPGPFTDHDADLAETVGHLKVRVLAAFGLQEGSTPDGGSVTYRLYHDKTPLDDLSQTLGQVAGDKKVLQLKLSQTLVQG
jgi:hypothetical protein